METSGVFLCGGSASASGSGSATCIKFWLRRGDSVIFNERALGKYVGESVGKCKIMFEEWGKFAIFRLLFGETFMMM